jgi:hypothetical protein
MGFNFYFVAGCTWIGYNVGQVVSLIGQTSEPITYTAWMPLQMLFFCGLTFMLGYEAGTE